MNGLPRRPVLRWLPWLLLLAGILGQLTQVAFFPQLRHAAFDTLARLSPREPRPLPVYVVDVDEASLARLGQWPWPRTRLAELVSRLTEQGAAAIALDILLAEPDQRSPRHVLAPWFDRPGVRELVADLPDGDRALAEAIAAGPVVTAFVLTHADSERAPARKAGWATAGDLRLRLPLFSGAVPSLERFEQAAAGNGALNFYPAADGRIRSIPLVLRRNDDFLPGLALETLRVALGQRSFLLRAAEDAPDLGINEQGVAARVRSGPLVAPINRRGELWLHFSPVVTDRYIPAWRVLAGDIDEHALRDGIVLIGATAAGLQDIHVNAPGEVISGVELHAQTIEQLLLQRYLIRPDWAVPAEIGGQLLISLVLIAAMRRSGPGGPALLVGLAVAAAQGLAFYAFVRQGWLFDPWSGSVTILAVYAAAAIVRHVHSESERRWIQRAFSSYVSPQLVEQLVEHPQTLRLGAERRPCSFIFTDLADFTTLTEQLDPARLVELLNAYLDGMIEVAFRHGGTVDKIVGDAVLVMFSAPVEQSDHAARALRCALAMDRFARDFAAARRAEGLALGDTRIGVHSGVATVGNFGGRRRFDYTAFGDVINTAARLETANKSLGTRVCASAAVLAQCPDMPARPIGTLLLKGKTVGIEAFEPLADKVADSPRIVAYRRAFQQLATDPSAAWDAFRQLARRFPDDPLIAFHHQRLSRGETGMLIDLAY
jgi:adenylate cyclase